MVVEWIGWVAASIVTAAGLGFGGLAFRRWRILVRLVESTSVALRERRVIDERFRHQVVDRGPWRLAFAEQVGSKARFDRFDLVDFLLDRLDEIEQQVRAEVALRQSATEAFHAYSNEVRLVGERLLGTTRPSDGAAVVDRARFDRVERKRFGKGGLRRPSTNTNVGTSGGRG